MLRDDAITRMREMLGHNSSLQASSFIDALKDAQETLEKEPQLPWFLRTEISSISTVANEERVVIPTDFLLMPESDDDGIWVFIAGDDNPWRRLRQDHVGFNRGKYSNEDDAEPKAYSLDNLYFRLFPTPDKIFTIKMIFLAQDALLDTNIENKWLEHIPWLLIAMGVQQVAWGTRDTVASTTAAEVETRMRARLRAFIVAREIADMPLQMGGPHV